jgi:hypothetical protein
MAILPDLSQLSREQLAAMVQQLTEAQAKPQRLSCKVSEKGALCVYGLGRFPVTLYASQWKRLLDSADAIRAFAKENASKLATKA